MPILESLDHAKKSHSFVRSRNIRCLVGYGALGDIIVLFDSHGGCALRLTEVKKIPAARLEDPAFTNVL